MGWIFTDLKAKRGFLTFPIGILAALFLAGLGLAAAQAQEQPITLADYRARLTAARADLAAGEEKAPVLPSIPPVVLSSGESVTPAAFLTSQGDPAVAMAHIDIAIQQLDLSANDNTAVRLAQLDRVADTLNLLQPSLWERFTRWLWDWLDRLLPERSPIAGGALGNAATSLVGWATIAVGGLLIVLLLSYWLRRLLAGLLSGEVAGNGPLDADDLPATATQARQQASQQAQDGNYREAVRRLYLAALLRLAERGLIRFDPSLTNWEVLARVDASAPARVHLQPVVETFDRVWYGEQEPDARTFDVYSQEIDALLREREGTRRG